VAHSPGITWDHYFLYGPNATWRGVPAPLAGDGGDVIDTGEQLRTQVSSLLKTE
jgi:hypothetical protein